MARDTQMEDGGEVVDSMEGAMEASALFDSLGPSAKLRIIDVLVNAGGGPLNPHDIAKSANISRSAFYDNRDTLLEYGLMEKVGSAGNSPLYALGDSEIATLIEKYTDLAGQVRRKNLGPEQ